MALTADATANIWLGGYFAGNVWYGGQLIEADKPAGSLVVRLGP